MAQLRVTLKKSVVGQQWRARRTVAAFGFTKVNQSRVFPDNDSIRGMVHKVKHLVVMEPVEENAPVDETPSVDATPAGDTGTHETETTE